MSTPTKVRSAPGIKRDGTVLEGDSYIDGQWTRFQRGLPRKMGGYQAVTSTVPELARGMSSFSADANRYIVSGGASTLSQFIVGTGGTLNGQDDRFPAALSANAAYLWQLDYFYDAAAVVTDLVAHPGANLAAIDSTFETPIFIGPVTGTGLLVDSTLGSVSGGICVVGPYLFSFGNNGEIAFSAVNNPTMAGSSGFVTQQKVIVGKQLRGSGSGPAALFWSLDSLIRASFVDGATIWAFDTITSETSILSSQGVIEYDGVYYWPGVDRWLMFNGVVRDIPNNFNINWFFDNLNFSQRQKVFAYKVPRFGEIWWCYPRGNATECTHAVILNVREGYWYDTALPMASDSENVPGRTAGVYAKVASRPYMIDADNVGVGSDAFTLWQHEIGVDRIDGAGINPIPAHIETSEIGMPVSEQPSNLELRVGRLEPDFVQSGPLTLTVRGRANPKAPFVASDPATIPEVAAQSTDETVKLKEIRRLMSFKFESNTQGGNFQFGESLAHIETAGERIES